MELLSVVAVFIGILTGLFHLTDATVYMCGNDSPMETYVTYSDIESQGTRFDEYSENLDKCMCTVRSNGTIHLKTNIQFIKDADDGEAEAEGEEDEGSECGPLLRVGHKEVGYYVCPSNGMGSKNDTAMNYLLKDNDQVTIELINSKKTPIKALMSFEAEVFEGRFSIECAEVIESTSVSKCPCNTLMYGGGVGGYVTGGDVSTGTRLGIGFTCVFAFLLIAGILFALWWFKLRNKDDESVDENGTAKDATDGGIQIRARPPQGLTHVEKGHDNPQFTEIRGNGQHSIGFEPDPELNLALQTTPGGSMGSKGIFHGSSESGIYSQGNGQYYANVPGDVDGLPPDMLYTPGLNLSGHADLQGPAPARSRENIDIYAKPQKSPSGGHPPQHPFGGGGPQQPTGPAPAQGPRTGSQDHLHPPGKEWAVNECYVSDSSHNASQGSLNTSQPVVETDV